ncbi:TonB-dependent receptor plug domain-containing protein [Riemerella columbina]|uniref:TonB-dependent receptor plug domain-containing protein n=1 Tax=Riemerella columbina TaxID=103810 RepID=UPI00266F5273|nr:TonB-dependent receptor [Riemerella columbina]WKS94576.1 TonB-dependent receptor plug domain-containing protein [Riemerella columbina]
MKKTILSILMLSNTLLYAQKDSINTAIEEVVMTGTLKPVSRDKSPVPVEVFSSQFFEKKQSSCLLESVEMINGVRPQLNCSVCNTGDIHINGLEGPYTMILIDGMPIVSSLSTVYGLSGIPNSLIDRVEVVKGPASSIYGSEAMGGIINVITKNALKAPKLNAHTTASSWGEYNTDLGTAFKLGDRIGSLLSLNYYNFQQRMDLNRDHFMDAALQDRISIFNKWNFNRPQDKVASFALRYLYEDRAGGVMDWDKYKDRGSNQVYGESIFTNRVEAIAAYELPIEEKIITQWSYNYHHQDSFYGDTPFLAKQSTFFGQMFWDKTLGASNLLLGIAVKNTYYDDNTLGTLEADGITNRPQNDWIPGAFIQNQWQINDQQILLLGYRLDLSKIHGWIHSPRIAYKRNLTPSTQLRTSFGTGFRVVNLFTEEHAALTGSRQVVISEQLNPERSYNANLNLTHRTYLNSGYINLDLLGFYSYFTNKIIGDFDTNPNQILYYNLTGKSISAGASLNTEFKFEIPLSLQLGLTYMEVYKEDDKNGVKTKIPQLFAPKWSGTYALTYHFPKKWTLDFTGIFYGPMRLPILPNDFRPEYSPWYTLANLQLKKEFSDIGLELYAGVKNIFNFTPKNPLMRPDDPFDQNINDPVNNPMGYTFDTAYGYAPMTGIRTFLGLKYIIK